MSFERWCQWLLYASIFFVVFGVLTAIAPDFWLIGAWSAKVDAVFFPVRVHPNASTMRAFMMVPLGATIAGTYILQCFVVAIPFRKREPWAWHAILWSTLAWFVLDSGLSIFHGAAFNVYTVNIAPLILFGIPLVATRSMARGGNP